MPMLYRYNASSAKNKVVSIGHFGRENATYVITSIDGKNLHTNVVSDGSIGIQNLKTGIYFVNIKTKEGERVMRFVKE